jgi:two-component system LytT family response regulator
MMLRTLVVDDEPLARRHARRIIERDPEIAVVGECGNGRDALAAIAETSPDLVLLDVQMPELDGFEVVAALSGTPPERMPMIVFVTAYDEYAIRAFDVHALDYVLKPVERERLLTAVARAKQRLAAPAARQEAQGALRTVADAAVARRRGERLAVRIDGKHLLLETSAIGWLEAVDDYVRIHLGRTTHLVRGTLQTFEQQLPPNFLRIHRSAILNVDHLREVTTTPQGDYRLTLQDGTRLPTGRSYRGVVADLLQSFTVGTR